MGRKSLKTLVAIVMLSGFAAEAGAQEGIVTPKAGRAVAMQSDSNERRPPQAPPPDPSNNPDAPPDVRRIRRAVGGFVGGLVGLGVGSLLVNVGGPEHLPPPSVLAVPAGMVIGVWLGGR
jgi:uncharacterized membrane protein YfcA